MRIFQGRTVQKLNNTFEMFSHLQRGAFKKKCYDFVDIKFNIDPNCHFMIP